MQAIAAGDIPRVDDVWPTVRIDDGSRAARKFVLKIQKPHPTQHGAANVMQPALEVGLGLPLANQQQKRIGAVNGVIGQPEQLTVKIGHREATALQTVVDHGLGQSEPAQVLQGARLH